MAGVLMDETPLPNLTKPTMLTPLKLRRLITNRKFL